MTIYLLVFLMVGLLFGAAAILGGWCAWRLTPGQLLQVAGALRNPVWGGVLGLIALLWCVPYSRPIAFDWMQNYLYVFAVVLAVLGYFFLDFLLARAVAGLLILGAYLLAHGSFVYHTPLGAVAAVAAWSLGVVGIVISGRPLLARAWAELIAQKRSWKIATAIGLTVLGVILWYAVVATLIVQVAK